MIAYKNVPRKENEEGKIKDHEKGKEDMKPILQPILLIIHKNIPIVKGQHYKIHKTAVE